MSETREDIAMQRSWEDREIDRLRTENATLRDALKIANDQTERFERESYLKGDEIAALRGALADIAYSDDMTLKIARAKAGRVYMATAGKVDDE